MDGNPICAWHRLCEEDSIEGLASFGCECSACRLAEEQQAKLVAWIIESPPRWVQRARQRAGVAMLPGEAAPRNWRNHRDHVTDIVRVIDPEAFRVLA